MSLTAVSIYLKPQESVPFLPETGHLLYAADDRTRKRLRKSRQSSIILFVLAVFLPPAAVLIARGCGAHFCLNILLTLLGWLPGLLHAWYVVARQDRIERMRRYEGHYGMQRRRPAYR